MSEVLDAYVGGLRDIFGDGLAGVYLYGSAAWGAYDPTVSDLDVAVLHFGVLGRSLYTLRTREISGKARAARRALGEADLRWRPLIERALTRYEGGNLSGSDPLLEKAAQAFAIHLRKVVG